MHLIECHYGGDVHFLILRRRTDGQTANIGCIIISSYDLKCHTQWRDRYYYIYIILMSRARYHCFIISPYFSLVVGIISFFTGPYSLTKFPRFHSDAAQSFSFDPATSIRPKLMPKRRLLRRRNFALEFRASYRANKVGCVSAEGWHRRVHGYLEISRPYLAVHGARKITIL